MSCLAGLITQILLFQAQACEQIFERELPPQGRCGQEQRCDSNNEDEPIRSHFVHILGALD
jgi:hypothetical protein